MSVIQEPVTLSPAQATTIRAILEREQERAALAVFATNADLTHRYQRIRERAERNLPTYKARRAELAEALAAFPESKP